jgi:GNAT superfamily N-acetyltransferase
MLSYLIRPIGHDSEHEVHWVADRMRRTLIEVFGAEVGENMYSIDWLRARVRWHLDPSVVSGEVFLVETEAELRGYSIVRVELDAAGARTGLMATTYVEPAWRRRGLAQALLSHAEAWFSAQGVVRLATNTSQTNQPLIALFERNGYQIMLTVPETRMIRLEKGVSEDAP